MTKCISYAQVASGPVYPYNAESWAKIPFNYKCNKKKLSYIYTVNAHREAFVHSFEFGNMVNVNEYKAQKYFAYMLSTRMSYSFQVGGKCDDRTISNLAIRRSGNN